jgi:putative transmembrane protein PGPGW
MPIHEAIVLSWGVDKKFVFACRNATRPMIHVLSCIYRLMFERIKQSWQRFKRSKPGHRFKQRYYEKQRSGRSTVRKILVITAGLLIFAAGIFFLPAPGPGTIILLIGASLIAEESIIAARGLDWAEVRLRSLYAKSLCLWKRTSPAIRVLVVICAILVVAALALGAYKIAFS